ncbi:hypothetical protein [Dongia sp. agr-C8]
MGSREAARKLVILPIAVGVLVALVATALDFGAGIPVFMDSFGWDLLRGYRCFILPKQLVNFCMVAAPIASALIFLTRPRLREPARENSPPPPAISSVDQVATIVGVIAFAAMIAVYHLFGAGWIMACKLESAIGVVSRYLLGAVVVVFAPAVSIAALSFAYSLRQGLRFNWVGNEARAALRQVGLMVALIAMLNLDYAILTRHGGLRTISGTLALLACGFLLTQGSLTVARIIGLLSAIVIALSVSEVLTAPIQTPLGLLLAKFRAAPVAITLAVIMIFTWFGVALWVYQALQAKPIREAAKAAGRTRFPPPWTGFIFGLLIFALGLGNYLMMEARYGDEARKRARLAYGEKYAFQITGYGYAGYTDHVFVQLEGYNDTELIKVQVDWKEQPK